MTESSSRWRAQLQLMRIPNVFTAVADVTMGFLFVSYRLERWPTYLMLVLTSASLYLAGMVLNDVFDVEQDRRERPERPIPSGRVPIGQARRLGVALLAGGVIGGWVAPWLSEVAMPGRVGSVATLLALLVVLYDAVLKRTPWGPLAMGGCRLLNVLLGMAAARSLPGDALWAGFNATQWMAAGGIGLYIAGVTWFARTEARASSRVGLFLGLLVMAAGIFMLGLLYRNLPAEVPVRLARESTWALLLGLLAFTIMRRGVIAVMEPSPQHVQLAVKNAIWSLIVLDAAVALLVADPRWVLLILALLLPTMVLGRRIAAT